MSNTAVRARDLGIELEGTPGPFNAITDISDVAVGLKTIIEDTPRPGRPLPVRTGVTAIMPHHSARTPVPVWAGVHRFNGNGEMTGTHWIADGGYFLGPVVLTNTHAVGMAHHATVKWMLDRYAGTYDGSEHLWLMPVIAETYDGALNDINGLPVTETDVREALDTLQSGPVPEGSVGGGTGMIAYEFKAGTGTASRRVRVKGTDYTVGALVQANHGMRDWFNVQGVPVGKFMTDNLILERETGSIIVVIGTDAPLAPHQIKRLARRGSIGIGRNGTVGGNGSGDIFLAFSTANPKGPLHGEPAELDFTMMNDRYCDALYEAAVQCVEESVLNAMVAARDMGGTEADRFLVKAIDHNALRELLERHGRKLIHAPIAASN
ncbi:DmpA family aminopeptidase [Cucumibacter marinus]|uniref:DmpA family aminopeptidase n=1 Tax=Cucumibacter marinus TaxID=1121252 RepID=UPI0004271EC9|nr:P1 family peptidase [Cucumibacter marinus]